MGILNRWIEFPVKLWDMKVRASARILEKGIQDNLIEEVERHRGDGRS